MSSKKQLQNISILCNGSRGDYQPYLALAVALKDAGFNSKIISNKGFKKYSLDFGIDHLAIWDFDSEQTVKDDPDVKEVMATGDLQKFLLFYKRVMKEIGPAACKDFMEEMKSNPPDLLVVGSSSEYFGWYADKVLNIPIIEVRLQTLFFSSERAPFGIPVSPDGSHMNGYLESIVNSESRELLDDTMESLGHPRLTDVFSKDALRDYFKNFITGQPDDTIITCQSSMFKDILAPGSNEKLAYVGPCVLNAKQQKDQKGFFGGDENEKKLEEFLSQDPDKKPVYCGWGSMVCKSPEHMVKFVTKSLQISGERGVVVAGFAGLSFDMLKQNVTDDDELLAYTEKNILFLDKASHESVFPRMKCTVHHGGAGTTNVALRSGVPTIITPVFLDQFDHTEVIEKLGNGIGFSKQFQKITAEGLGEAIKKVANTSEMHDKAKEVQAQSLKDDGTNTAVTMIKEYWESIA